MNKSNTEKKVTTTAPGEYKVIKRNNEIKPFEKSKISMAISKAFLAVEGNQAANSTRIKEKVDNLTENVINALFRRLEDGGTIHIEEIQDQVELQLMRAEEHKVAISYVIYRDQHKQKRENTKINKTKQANTINIINNAGKRIPLDHDRLYQIIDESVADLTSINKEILIEQAYKNIFDGMGEDALNTAIVMCARQYIEKDPDYSTVAARLLLDGLRTEALSFLYNENRTATHEQMKDVYPACFKKYINKGVELELLDPKLNEFDLDKIASAIMPDRDMNFTYLGLQTLYDRYFIHSGKTKIELPQCFFMRVSMGLAINEVDREEKTIEFYNLLSSFDFMSSTPTLFNSGTLRPQLSSCYLTTVPDDLVGIFDAIKDDALLSKYAGGLGNDWTRVRGLGARIKGTNGESQGVVPFLKVANDTAVAVNQGGKRKGAMCAYLETWHIDIEEFLDLRKNTGDDRRRTHDMNTANWIPDLFMERVAKEKQWTLFSPEETPELHDLYGQAFKEKYEYYEGQSRQNKIANYKVVNATELWRKMLGMLFETGHPWITFKDPCNIRSPQQHTGVVHSSNLCTEITLNTSDDEIAVCNLGSINLPQHSSKDGLDHKKLENTINTAMRMLDNVIDYNYYSVPQARRSNLKHRPVGLGIMGFQDALYIQDMKYGSEEAVKFADISMETISYYTIQASSNLAKERGCYESYPGSLWSKGILPIDSIDLLEQERGDFIQVDKSFTMDWNKLRKLIKRQGMRNSNTMAIAPTATISNISGVSQSIEPIYQNLFVKSNLSGEFTIVNKYLVNDLKALDLWDDVMINDLKYFDGSVNKIDRIPENLKLKYATAFEVDPGWLIESASRRQKWIDQGQSLNLYMADPSGNKLDRIYKLAWVRGLKTTYYLRSLGATQAEKGVEKSNTYSTSSNQVISCSILDPDCEACQ